MAEDYTVAGLYQEDVTRLSPRPGFRTGVPAFIGYVQSGYMADGKPQKVMRWAEYPVICGNRQEDGFLFDVVRGFFQNGGRYCYVVPLAPGTEKSKRGPLRDTLSESLRKLAPVQAVDLVCTPDIMASGSEEQQRAAQQILLNFCHDSREAQFGVAMSRDRKQYSLGNRFAILDSPPRNAGEPPGACLARTVQKFWRVLDGINGAIYYPWVVPERRDKAIPPCGHVAATYAVVDRDHGFFRAPANVPLEGVVTLEDALTNELQRANNPDGVVNCIRQFPGRGIRVWGARTLSGDQRWYYVNVRRLFISLERWLAENMFDIAFEPNGPALWARVGRELAPFLNDLFERGALTGKLPWEAFYVNCGPETNPPEMRELGSVSAEIGLAPSVPNEFIVVRLIQGAQGSTITTT